MTHRRSEEGGFTMLEVLVTIAIAAIVLTTISLSIAQGFSETAKASKRLDRQNMADFAAGVFASDAASSATSQPATSPCGADPTILDIAQSDGTWVSWAMTSDGLGTYTLIRRACDGATTTSRRLGSARAAIDAAPEISASCATSCRLKVTWPDGEGGGFTLSGTRRAS